MGSFKAEASLKQANRFGEIASPLIVLQEFVEFFCMNNNVKATNLRESEFFFLQACAMNLFPDPEEV